jgi:hypothetical protein
MSDNLMDSVAPHLAAPVTRHAGGTAADSGAGADLAIPLIVLVPFADDSDS